jgi:hypothetical protein
VVERLIRRHPEVDDSVIIELVAETHRYFADARVRDFIPLLVERRANRELTRSRGSEGP